MVLATVLLMLCLSGMGALDQWSARTFSRLREALLVLDLVGAMVASVLLGLVFGAVQAVPVYLCLRWRRFPSGFIAGAASGTALILFHLLLLGSLGLLSSSGAFQDLKVDAGHGLALATTVAVVLALRWPRDGLASLYFVIPSATITAANAPLAISWMGFKAGTLWSVILGALLAVEPRRRAQDGEDDARASRTPMAQIEALPDACWRFDANRTMRRPARWLCLVLAGFGVLFLPAGWSTALRCLVPSLLLWVASRWEARYVLNPAKGELSAEQWILGHLAHRRTMALERVCRLCVVDGGLFLRTENEEHRLIWRLPARIEELVPALDHLVQELGLPDHGASRWSPTRRQRSDPGVDEDSLADGPRRER
jgi:hypothetical protein